MVQHLLLMMVAPPLLWLGAPLFPLLRGLPRPVRIYWVAPAASARRSLRRVFGRLTHPVAALAAFRRRHLALARPGGLRRPPCARSGWHYLQHVCFLGAALLFWYPVVRPYPGRPRWSPWLLLPYLILADVQNTVLSALLTFSDRVLYPHYAEVPRLGGISALDDQAAAGVLMWVPGSVAFLVPLFAIGVRLLFGESRKRGRSGHRAGRRQRPPERALARSSRSSARDDPRPPRDAGFDLLRVPLLGRFLRWRHARLACNCRCCSWPGRRSSTGCAGPQVGAMNLAGVLPWIHWRGLLDPRAARGRQRLLHGLPVPAAADARPPLAAGAAGAGRGGCGTSGWPSSCSSSSSGPTRRSPSGTARGGRPGSSSATSSAAFVVDGLFRGASFCKYVCPIGQFNFVQSLVSPLEVKVRDPDVCAACRTKDCIRGRRRHPRLRAGPVPAAQGRATWTAPSASTASTPARTTTSASSPASPAASCGTTASAPGVGRFGRRPDLAALVLVLVFGAFANAAGMVGPGRGVAGAARRPAGRRAPPLAITTAYLPRSPWSSLPLLAVGGAAVAESAVGRLRGRRPGGGDALRLRPGAARASACGWRTTAFTS